MFIQYIEVNDGQYAVLYWDAEKTYCLLTIRVVLLHVFVANTVRFIDKFLLFT